MIELSELESYLWGSAELLRTSIDAGSYKQYIFPLLFLKRMSDVYDEECDHIREEFPDDPDAIDWEENHVFMIPDGAHWIDVRNVTENIGEALVKAFRAIEKSNPEKLSGIFGNAAWTNKNRLPDRLLKDLIEHFSSQTLSLENCPEDELGQGYEYLIKKFADDSGHTAQEFYTNRTVVHLMTEMLQPQSGESVYDPTCGSGGMLISCVQYVQDQGKEWRNISLYGQEINSLSCAIGRMNCYLHGIKDFEIVNDDTLKNPAFIKDGKLQTFDICLANPPYSISQWDRSAFETDKYGRNFLGVPNQNRADFAFIQHILKSLNSNHGRCAILLPHGILNRQEEASMRKKMVEMDLVDCVIGVGKNLFYNSPMEACVLICGMNKPVCRKNKVLFIDARNYVTRKGTESFMTSEQIDFIADIYREYKDVYGVSKVVSASDVLKKGASLEVIRFVDRLREINDDRDSSVEINAEKWNNASILMRFSYNEFLKVMKEDL